MQVFRLGCVPYVNARPLIRAFRDATDVEIDFRVPSQLPALLDSSGADAVLASSFDALSRPGRTFAAGIAIASTGPVESVRLLSKVPFESIGRLALDASSLTSNHLARIVLAERYGSSPDCSPQPPDAHAMLARFDAAVLIGDAGMQADASELHVLDLGAAWLELTGLPFVWALWIGTDRLSPTLSRRLTDARDWGSEHLDEIAAESAKETGMTIDRCFSYLSRTMQYAMTEAHTRGLMAYADRLHRHGFVHDRVLPVAVEPD